MSIFKKVLKIIGVTIALLILLILWLAYPWQKQNAEPSPVSTPSAFEMALADPNLLYAYSSWSGMCRSEINREEGGCHSEAYLYDSGKYVSTGFWEGMGNKKIESPRVEKQLSKVAMDGILTKMRDSGIMDKECPDNMTVDAGWDYQLQLDGKKKRFINRPVECQKILDEIGKIIEETASVK
ncbi:MAG: hypothetical protein NT098_05435 [Candidatus Parcubacteria bacterium]|nr:hypothetical protein [Candidatus Parcubacteria bacterium]